MQCLALWTVGAGRCEVRREDVPVAKEGLVLVRTTWSAVSRGTEALVVRGGVPTSEHERMRGPNMGGSFQFPVKYGYSCVGVVEASALPEFAVGDRVFCLHPHQTRFAVSDVRRVPEETPSHRAVLAPNMETAVNVTWDAGIGIGDRVCVVGGGVVGLLVAYLAAKTAAVEVLDLQNRRAQCEALGVAVYAGGKDFDVVIHASGTARGLATCLELAGDQSTIVEASWHGDRPCSLALGEAFHSRRLTIKSSQVGRIPTDRVPRWDYARRMQLALKLCADPKLDCLFEAPDLVFGDTPAFTNAYCAALEEGRSGLCYRIRYDEEV